MSVAVPLMRAVLVLLIAGLLVMAAQGSAGAPGAADPRSGRSVPLLPSPHIHLGERHRPYNSIPPTSGAHWAETVGTGVYREELPEEIQVHVLEHGHILLQYAPQTPAAEMRRIERLGRLHVRDVVVAPYSKLAPYARRGQGIALTAWARIERLGAVDEQAVTSFVRAFSGRYDHGDWRGGRPPPDVRRSR
jgi:hypothetical protein